MTSIAEEAIEAEKAISREEDLEVEKTIILEEATEAEITISLEVDIEVVSKMETLGLKEQKTVEMKTMEEGLNSKFPEEDLAEDSLNKMIIRELQDQMKVKKILEEKLRFKLPEVDLGVDFLMGNSLNLQDLMKL